MRDCEHDSATAKAKREELKSRLAKIKFLLTNFSDEGRVSEQIPGTHSVRFVGLYASFKREQIGKCEACWKTILTDDERPSDEFYADKLVVLKSKGGQTTRDMFSIFLAVEMMLIDHFTLTYAICSKKSFRKLQNFTFTPLDVAKTTEKSWCLNVACWCNILKTQYNF